MRDTSVIEVDLAALERNVRFVQQLVGTACSVCPILKADGYGMGAAVIARRLARAGCGMFAVYSPSEAVDLLEAGVDGRVLVLRPVRGREEVAGLATALAAGRVHLALHDAAQLRRLASFAAGLSGPLHVHVDVDTGMSRGGCSTEDLDAVLRDVASSPAFVLAGISTHFASADTDEGMTSAQMQRFERIVEAHEARIGPECIVHAANSFATLRGGRFHRSMVRVGLAWTGHGPEWMADAPPSMRGDELTPILRWTSRMLKVRPIEPGTKVGYGATWTARRRTVLAVVPVGYADGFPMTLSTDDDRAGPACVGVLDRNDTSIVRGYARVVGAVSMDQITIDVTDLVDRFGDDVSVDTPVELISRRPVSAGAPNHLAALARAAGTIPHELLCRLNPRIARVYHDAGLTVQTFETKPMVSRADPALETPVPHASGDATISRRP